MTKGVSFSNARLFAQERFGEAAWQTMLSELTAEEQAAIAAMIPMGWYELDLYARVLKQIERVESARPGTSDVLVAFGRFSAEQDLTKLHKLFMRLVDPGSLFDQAMKVWQRFHDSGSWSIEHTNKSAAGTLTGWSGVDNALCRALAGYIEGLLRSSHGGKDTNVQHTECRAHGAKACVFVATWR